MTSSPSTDRWHAAARNNVQGYIDLMRGLLQTHSADQAHVLMNKTLENMGTGIDALRAQFVMALEIAATPPVDLPPLD
jgi:hypothetical protein